MVRNDVMGTVHVRARLWVVMRVRSLRSGHELEEKQKFVLGYLKHSRRGGDKGVHQVLEAAPRSQEGNIF